MRIAVDFDGTINLNESDYPHCISPNKPLIEYLKKEKEKGMA